MHRLDRDTSGLMIVARTEEAHRDLSAQIKAREVGRTYTALVEGHLASRTGTIDAPVGRDHRAPERMTVGGRAPRDARTHFEVVEALPADSLVEARLDTGRTHQIRTHFAAIGHPVAGDPRYGHAGRHGLERQFLHSSRLRFRHPGTGEELSFESALPDDLAAALGEARGRGHALKLHSTGPSNPTPCGRRWGPCPALIRVPTHRQGDTEIDKGAKWPK